MTKHNEDNERIKRTYFTFLKEAKRLSVQSVDGVASATAAMKAIQNTRTSGHSTPTRLPLSRNTLRSRTGSAQEKN